MRRLLRWIGIGAAGLVGCALLGIAAVYLVSGQVMARGNSAQMEALAAPTMAQLADAPRQARILGCVSCHGEGLTGKVMFEKPGVARVNAPNLTLIAARASNQQLAAAIRQGIGHDGRKLFVMPSPMYSRLSDGETTALIAWIRSLPRRQGETGGMQPGPLGRFAVATGRFKSSADKVEQFQTQAPIMLGAQLAAGRRLAANTCSECHGPALFGQRMESGDVTPDLAIVGAYDPAQFRTLLRTGQAPHKRDLGLMARVARGDFRHLSDSEIDALYAYLKARADRS